MIIKSIISWVWGEGEIEANCEEGEKRNDLFFVEQKGRQ